MELAIISLGQTDAHSSRPALRHIDDTPLTADNSYEVKYVSNQKMFGASPGTAPVIVLLPKDEILLVPALRRELTAAYNLHGWPGVAQFAAGVFGLDRYDEFLNRNGLGARDFGGPATGDKAIGLLRDAVGKDRSRLWAAFEVERTALRRSVIKREAELTAAAHDLAKERIARCRQLLVSEAVRYLSLAEPKVANAQRLLSSGSPEGNAQAIVGLRGPDGGDLKKAVASIFPLLERLKQEQADFTRSRLGEVTEQNLAKVGKIIPAAAIWASAAKALTPDAQTVRYQETSLAATSQDFASQFSQLTAAFPILFRLVDEDATNEAELTQSVVSVLQDAWSNAASFEKELNSDATPKSSTVWTLPALIDLTVRSRYGSDSPFSERVAADLLKARGAQIPPMALLNGVISAIDTGLMLVPFPPVQLATLLVSIVGSMAELAESWVLDTGKRASHRMALDPSLSLGTEPTALGLAFGGLMIALSIIPVPGLTAEVKALRKVKAG